MATIQEQLQAEIDKIKADTLLLHSLVHGTDTQTVTTDNGIVGSVAKQIKDKIDTLNSTLQAALDEFNLTEDALGTTLTETQATLTRANSVVSEAEAYLTTAKTEVQGFITDAEGYVSDASSHATAAQTSANEARSIEATYGLSLPGTLTGKAGSVIAVNPTESGYEFVGTSIEFSGVKRVGSKLVFDQGTGIYTTDDYGFWSITGPGVGVEISANGEFIVTF